MSHVLSKFKAPAKAQREAGVGGKKGVIGRHQEATLSSLITAVQSCGSWDWAPEFLLWSEMNVSFGRNLDQCMHTCLNSPSVTLGITVFPSR